MPDAAELHRRAGKVLPRNVYDYYAGGSGRERILRAGEKAWRQLWLAPRVLREVSSVDTGSRLLGAAFSTPPCVAPTGYQRLAHPDGELATAAGAARAGALFVLFTTSTCRIEDVADSVARHGGTWWFQVDLMRPRPDRGPGLQAAPRPFSSLMLSPGPGRPPATVTWPRA